MQRMVLIVDDEAGVRDMARLVLAREGYGVLTASDGRAALDVMADDDNASKVSVLVCDLEMPNVGGKDLIDRFRMQFPAIPIIVLSGASDTVFLEGIVQEGVCDWLKKPVTREVLLEKVKTAVNLSDLRRQHRSC